MCVCVRLGEGDLSNKTKIYNSKKKGDAEGSVCGGKHYDQMNAGLKVCERETKKH